MSIFQKSASISFSDSIIQNVALSNENNNDGDKKGRMLVRADLKCSLFEEDLADIFLLTSFVEGQRCLADAIEERAKQEDSQIEREALRNTLFLRLRTLLPHEYERIFVQRKANLSMPVPQSLCPLDMPKHSTSLKLVHFINRPVQDFDPKMLARHLAVAEAFMFVRLDEREFFYSTAQQSFSSIDAFIERYNRLTQILISATLQSKTPAKLAQFILKMAREFYELGTMNGFKACLAALQSACIHRLHLCDELSSKYRRRMLEFEEFSQAKDNFVLMRQTRCLVPWIGLLLKDINFISEVVKLAGNAGPTVGPSLRKVFQSIAESRGACSEWIQRNQHMLSQVSKILDWLDGTPVLYDTEELQYQKSKAIKS